ncbi:MAG: restriction endonuclease subunit S [Flavobacteriaceae bacterium]|nr:restriction endonuclease subunit S [Flavobacteriaceae bacterium]
MSSVDEIPNGWKETSLGDISLRKQYGYTESASTEEIGPKFLRITDIQNDFIDWKTVPYCPISDSDLEKYKLQIGDVVIARTGNSTGATAAIKEEINAVFASYLIRFQINSEIADYNFIDFLVRSRFWSGFVNSVKSGSAQGGANANDFAMFPINLPPLPEQKAIANILTAFDSKIENLQAQNNTLEQTAQTIFKEWFGKYQVGDELPDGWRITQLRELAKKISKGTTPRKKDVEGLDVIIPFLKVKDISDEGLINKDSLELIPKEVHNKQLKRSILKHNDILFSIAGTIGRVAIVDNELENSNCNQALAFIRLNDVGKLKEYVHLWLKSNDVQNEITNSIVQGVQANVSLTVLGDLKITIPDESKLKEWKSLISPIYSKWDNNNSQIQTLKKTRDALLPKLMSGQVRVNGFKV